MQSNDAGYSWHLSLRVDRPVEGCTMRPHAYLYSKRLDHNDPPPYTAKKCAEPVPGHEFSYRWARGPLQEPCAFARCPRRSSFSPHDWSRHALGGGWSLRCVSVQSSLYGKTFCNAACFVEAWKGQRTVRDRPVDHDDLLDDTPSTTLNGSHSLSHMHSHMQHNNINNNGNNNNGDHPSDWSEISREAVYLPCVEDVGRKLKLECAAYSLETGELLMHRSIKTDLVLSRAPDPRKRNLVTVKGGGSSSGGARFRIVTYNVLAEIYATQQQYPYCDLWALNWDYRFQNILREVVDAHPDVICMQEIQADHYENHIYNAMIEAGFEGVYKQKTRQSMGLVGKVDGCALFWRRSKFHLVESYSIEFNELAQRQAATGSSGATNTASFVNRLSKDNVAQLVVLELVQPTLATRTNREPLNQLCVANTHLYSNVECPDVKLWQTWHLLQELETFVLSRQGPQAPTSTHLPLMICGDFNSTPDTAVYDLLSRQAVHPGHPDVALLPDPLSITHNFQLGSVYHTVMGEEPEFTNYTTQFKGVLDYMWYSAQNLRPLSAAPIPDEDVLVQHGDALPSTQYSSDHIMMISDMQILAGSRPS